MKKAKIFIADGSGASERDVLRQLLGQKGHEIVLEASDLHEALRLIRAGHLQATGINLALVDGILSLATKDWSRKGARFKDGKMVAEAILKADPAVKIIAYCCFDNPTYGDVCVSNMAGSRDLLNAIDAL